MHLEILRSLDELASISQEWNELLSCCSASHVPFLRSEYIMTWWKTLGGGEWDQGELFVVTGRGDQGELVGVAPLFFTHNSQGQPALMLLGSVEISDYLDLIVHCDNQVGFIGELLDLLDAAHDPSWEVLDWYNIPENSPTLTLLSDSATSRGWGYEQERLQPCPYIPLPGDWEAYLAAIDKKQRHEIRRKMRRLEEGPQSVRWYFVQEADQVGAEVDAFMQLMAMDPEKERFLSPQMREQMRATVQAAFQHGWLQLAFLEIDGIKAAGYLNFDFNQHVWVYNSGLNFNFRDYSPGWVLLGYLLQWANANQRLEFDFMRGNEQYKYRFGALDRYIARAVVRR